MSLPDVRLTTIQRQIFDAISREEGLPTQDAWKVCTDKDALKVHIRAMRLKKIPILSIRQKSTKSKRGGRSPTTYHLDKSVTCPTIL